MKFVLDDFLDALCLRVGFEARLRGRVNLDLGFGRVCRHALNLDVAESTTPVAPRSLALPPYVLQLVAAETQRRSPRTLQLAKRGKSAFDLAVRHEADRKRIENHHFRPGKAVHSRKHALRGQPMFTFSAYDERGVPHDESRILTQLIRVVEMSPEKDVGVGILTAEDRDVWAKVYASLGQASPRERAVTGVPRYRIRRDSRDGCLRYIDDFP
ncbi:hypothetical protein HPB47_018518 [Ixodes persulcatus]|uniref:Uncharacterized protein n=1 Tax=Ixodes persulcatus TaxID=34615 RepID=A0AC60QKK6_IXOPE|nr:hypothetical protein HPB47_018518 [Ixodes persulcatus]